MALSYKIQLEERQKALERVIAHNRVLKGFLWAFVVVAILCFLFGVVALFHNGLPVELW
jgi:hypothetical protein